LLLGCFLLLEMVATFVVLVAIWPDVAKVPNVSIVSSNAQVTATTTTTTPTTSPPTTTTTTTSPAPISAPGSISVVPPQQTFSPVVIFGYTWTNPSSEALYLVAVIALAVLGATLHALISFADFLGNRSFKGSWFWWYVLRAPTGAAIAVILYLAIRGGLLSVSTSTTNLSPYGIGAIAALAVLFSRHVSDKFKEVFDVLLPTKDVGRRDRLTDGAYAAVLVAPASLPVGSAHLVVQLHGQELSNSSSVRIGGVARTVTVLDATTVGVELIAADVAAAGVVTLEVVAKANVAPQLVHLRVRPRVDTARATTTPEGVAGLAITGAGFDADAKVKVGTVEVPVSTRSATSLVATAPASITLAGSRVVVVNPDAAGGASDPSDITT
jgi:hypothetical protein